MPPNTTNASLLQPRRLYQDLSYTNGPSPERDSACPICHTVMTRADRILTHSNGTCLRSCHAECLERALRSQPYTNAGTLHLRCPTCREPYRLRPADELPAGFRLRLATRTLINGKNTPFTAELHEQANKTYAAVMGPFLAKMREAEASLLQKVRRVPTTDPATVQDLLDKYHQFAEQCWQQSLDKHRDVSSRDAIFRRANSSARWPRLWVHRAVDQDTDREEMLIGITWKFPARPWTDVLKTVLRGGLTLVRYMVARLVVFLALIVFFCLLNRPSDPFAYRLNRIDTLACMAIHECMFRDLPVVWNYGVLYFPFCGRLMAWLSRITSLNEQSE